MLAVFGGLFIALFVVVGVADGIGHPSVPSGDVAVVEDAPDGTITQEDFDAALAQAAARQGLPKAPEPSDPQYATLRDSAMSAVLQARWFRGEAEERGITVSDTEITQRLQQFQKQVGNRAQFEKYIKKLGFTPGAGARPGRAVAARHPDPGGRPAAGGHRLRCPGVGLLRGQQDAVQPARDARRAPDRQRGSGPGGAGEVAAGAGRLAEELERGRRQVLDRQGDQGQRRPPPGGRRGPGRPRPGRSRSSMPPRARWWARSRPRAATT